MDVHVWSRPVAWPHSQQKHWPQVHCTRLQPPFFSTALAHFGHGLVLAVSQWDVSLSSAHFARQDASMEQVAGECGSAPQAKQKEAPQAQTGSTTRDSPCSSSARPQNGTLGQYRTASLSSAYDASRAAS